MTNFKNVFHLNRIFKRTKTSLIEDTDWDVIENQLKIIKSEFNELELAVKNRDVAEVKDGIGDVLVTAYGMGYRASFDCDLLMDNINDSNLSKLCYTDDEVKKTIAYYQSIGVKVYASSTLDANAKQAYAILSPEDQSYEKDGQTEHVPKGKFLKNVNWRQPDLNVDY